MWTNHGDFTATYMSGGVGYLYIYIREVLFLYDIESRKRDTLTWESQHIGFSSDFVLFYIC